MSTRINRIDNPQATELVAVIGMSCRLPGAENIQAYWRLLLNGLDAVTEVPADRWNADAFYDPDLAIPGKMNTRWGGFLKQVDQFDPFFFGISPREAVQMDPQQRLMLELSWEALADAGQDTDQLRESEIGVFFGASWGDYATLHHKDGTDYIAQHTATGTHFSIIANRVSYVFGFRGPSMTIDTACSSSLVAVHQACQSLRSGESTLALAGGVHLMLAPDSMMMISKFGGLSPDGRCRTFDARANGFVRGEGGGVVVLKPLAQALADNDPIYCVIRGSAVNNDGRDTGLSAMQRILTAAREIRNKRRRGGPRINPGLTVPNTAAQEAVLRAACRQADIAPEQVQYVEAHGTGTPLGDPIEAKAVSAIYCGERDEERPLLLGSVKTNIGHLEAAAGVAGLIKVALAIKHGLIPPSLHFEQPNPNIPFDELNLSVQTTVTEWPHPAERPMAGVSSFGFGGTNCHVLLAAAPGNGSAPQDSAPAQEAQARPMLLPLSARSEEARGEVAQSILSLVKAQPDLSLTNLCYTASRRSTHHPYRLVVAFTGREELIETLEAFGRGEEMANLTVGKATSMPLPKPVFVFSGQGPQWWAMGRELFIHEPVYREVVETCDRLLSNYADWSLIEELTADEAESRLAQTAVAQPALFALQVALAALWQSWGIEPGAVVGHSVGEVAAAHVAGSLSLEQAIEVVHHRGRLMQAAAGLGKMAAVGLAPEAARRLLNDDADRLAIAAVNGPDAVTLSGKPDALERLAAHLEDEDVFCRVLKVNYAFHSPQMAPFQQQLVAELDGLTPQPAVVPIISTVTGQVIEGQSLDAAYWGRNMRQTVQFDSAVATLVEEGHTMFIEIGPHPVLSGYIASRLEEENTRSHVFASLRRQQPERMTMLSSLGALYTLGYPLPWPHLSPAGQIVKLPPYPWRRERYWLPTNGHHPSTPASDWYGGGHPLLGRRLDSPLLGSGTAFESLYTLASYPLLDDHRLYQKVVVPAAHHISMMLTVVQAHLGADPCLLSDMTFTHALTPEDGDGRLVQIIITPDAERYAFGIHSRGHQDGGQGSNRWALHASGYVDATQAEAMTIQPPLVETIEDQYPESLSGEAFYQDFTAAGYHLGPRFQWLDHIWRGEGEAVGRMRLPQTADRAEMFQLHPGLLDSLFQLLCVTLPGGLSSILGAGDIYIPLGIDAFHFYGRSDRPLWCQAQLQPRQQNQEIFTGDVRLFDDSGRIVAEVTGLHFKRAPRDVLLRLATKEATDWLYEVAWQVAPEPAPVSASAEASWLVFSGGDVFSLDLIEQLRAEGHTCLVASPGDGFAALTAGQWQLDPTQPEDFTRLLAVAASENVSRIAFLWGLEAEPSASTTLAAITAAQERACQGVLYLVQALAQAEPARSPRLWIVTQRAQSITADETAVAVAQAPLWGLGRVIALEHPEIWGGLVDVEAGQASLTLARRHLLAADGEDQVAIRQRQRYVARLVRSPQRQATDERLPVRADSTYLITGGMGGLGLTFARWLVTQGARHVVLLGRRGPSAQAQETLNQLAEAGAEVIVMQADVSEASQIAGVMKRIQANLPPLRGVIHAAGVLRDGILMNQDWSRFAQVMAPKVAGGWNLHTHTQDQPLDFFVLFSSIAALMGSAGQGNYAAANAFLDALAHERRLQGLPALSVDWGAWASVGMANALDAAQKQRWQAHGIEMIPPTLGTELLSRVHQGATAQVGIFPINWSAFFRQGLPGNDRAFFSEFSAMQGQAAETTAVADRFLEELAEAAAAKKKDVLLQHIRQQAIQVLGMGSARRLDPQRRLFEMGLDSLMAVELQKRLQTSLNTRLSKTLVFDYPTVQFLTDYLATEVLGLEEATAEQAVSEPLQADLQHDIEELSEAEAEALLLAELGGSEQSLRK